MAEERRTPLTGVALGAAVTVVIAWLIMIGWLTQQTGATDLAWSRLLVVLGSLEAVAFAAAGALFGVQVQRQRVEDAHQHAEHADERANQARAQADANSTAAENGRTLARSVKRMLVGRSEETGVERTSARSDQAAREVLALAETLFPDV